MKEVRNMKITELIQTYDTVPTMTVSEVLHACFTDVWFYIVFLSIILFVTLIAVLFVFPSNGLIEATISTKEKDKTFPWKRIVSIVFCVSLAFVISYQLEKSDQEKRKDVAWNKEYVTPFFEKEPTKKEHVANFTFQGKDDRSAFDRFEKKEGYVFTGFIQNEKGEVKEETFFTEKLQYDLEKNETPYIEFKLLPKTINDEATKGRHQIIFHVDNTILKDILKHTKKE